MRLRTTPPPAAMKMASRYMATSTRRGFVKTFGTFAASGLIGLPSARAADLSVGALFAGRIDDGGFMEAGWRGLERARREFGVKASHIDRILPNKDALAAALTELAQSGASLVIAHGGQNNEAAAMVAQAFPKTQFVVTQGSVTAANLSSYDVLQEESAYLAGVLAALTTRTGVVGHMSGIRVRPGLKGRAAYAAGVRDTDPKVKLLTNFSGNQDDNALSRRVALAEIEGGADVIFTMLNAGRNGVTQACGEKGKRQIGNVVDWVKVDAKIFVASAIADVGIGVFNAVRDVHGNRFKPGVIEKIGLIDADAVRLTMAADVPQDIRARVDKAAQDLRAGRIQLSEQFDGVEFPTPV